MRLLANIDDPDEMSYIMMLHNVAFHQGLHCLLRLKRSSEKEIHYFFLNFKLEAVTPQYIQWTILDWVRADLLTLVCGV